MHKLSCLFVSLFVFQSVPVPAFEEIWKLGDHFITMEKNINDYILSSKRCAKEKCAATEILKTISSKNINASMLAGGKNPGAVLCDQTPEAKIIYMKDLNGNENTFCMFKDKSIISNSSLMVYASKNDGVKK